MNDHQIKRPTVFISHATSDGEFARAVQAEIERVFANGVTVFCTSSPGAIPTGSDWLQTIEARLQTAQSVIVLVTPVSVERPWVWFELGATWEKSRDGACKIYPVCVAEVQLSDLPAPLDRLQALSLGKVADLKLLFSSLIDQFGFGNISTFQAKNITSRIPKYKSVKISPEDSTSRSFYSGKYSGYSDEELVEVIAAGVFEPAESSFGFEIEPKKTVFDGMLVHYREIDRILELPPGTASRLLKTAADRYNAIPEWEGEHCVRFQRKVQQPKKKRQKTT